MKIAIVGSDSFLAGYIINELIKTPAIIQLFGISPDKYPELSFSKFRYPVIPLDTTQLLDADSIIYCAGAGIQSNLNENSNLIYELNAFQPIRLLYLLTENQYKGKFVSFGSYFEIGNETEERYYSEIEVALSNQKVTNHYATSKRILTRYLISAPYLPNHFHFILPNIYGLGENANRLIPYLINSIKSKTEIKLTSGSQVRQFIHTLDIAKAVLKVVNNDYPNGLYNLCNSEPIQIKTVVRAVFDIMGKDSDFNKLKFGINQRTDTAMPYLLLNSNKALKGLNFQPSISLEKGISTYL